MEVDQDEGVGAGGPSQSLQDSVYDNHDMVVS